MKRRILLLTSLLLLAVLQPLTGRAQQDEPIVVSSKVFTENIILGYLMQIALEDNGLAVEDRTHLAPTLEIRAALENGEIDIYPEYTSTGLFNFFRNLEDVPTNWVDTTDPQILFWVVSSLDAAYFDIHWLNPAPGNNAFGLIVTTSFAEENNLTTMRDFANYVNAGGEVRLVTSTEFDTRVDGLASFETTYGFELAAGQKLVIADASPDQTENAVASGVNGINVGMAFTTDARIQSDDLFLLEDIDGAQPLFQPTPVIRGDILRAYPQIVPILNPIFAQLDTQTLRDLNARVDTDGQSPRTVAQEYYNFLKSNNFFIPIVEEFVDTGEGSPDERNYQDPVNFGSGN